MANFIRNTENFALGDVINQLLPAKTKSMDFLVGYFYFSGMKEIYNNIEGKPMRLLVGLDIDHDLVSKTSEFDFFMTQGTSSREQIRNGFYDSLKALFNNTPYYESEEAQDAFRIYYEKIKDGTLEIRKTKEPCHAKMYIFDHKDELITHTPTGDSELGRVITGSSNLTYNGLKSNGEVNVELRDDDDYRYAKEVFEELWADAVIIADQDHIKDFEDKVMKQIWLDQKPSPYLMYLRVLYEYFHIDKSINIHSPHEISDEFMDLRYQYDAIYEAIKRINTHNGVIVADVVGLGKSIIGSSVAYNLNMQTLIIAPPHLVKQWEDYRVEFKVKAKVMSRGNMEKIRDFYTDHKKANEQWLIIVDEAHKFRNEYINDYALLHQICKGNKVMLLTATPFNNTPSDIYSMVKLFQNPTKSTLQTIDNLGAEFANLIATYKDIRSSQRAHELSAQEVRTAIESVGKRIRDIIEPIVIRRSRTDLDKIPAYRNDLKQQGFSFPKVNDPEILEYDLGGLENLYRATLLKISPREDDLQQMEESENFDAAAYFAVSKQLKNDAPTFQATRYKPMMYMRQEPEIFEKVKKQIEDAGLEWNLFIGTQKNLAAFMRTMLVRRFESSQYAFKISLDSMLVNCQNIKNWVEKRHKVPVFKQGMLPDISSLYESTDDTMGEILNETAEQAIESLKSKGMFELDASYLTEQFMQDLDSDIEILTELKEQWAHVPEKNDPKLNEFIKIIKKQLKEEPNRKIVVFSQFADTVEYLGKRLQEDEENIPVFAYTSGRASEKNKEYIKANFDAGYPEHKQVDVYKVLIATDAISEGYNLHRAGTIFNYDIPYNPTRVIQRVGRINRINKKVFDELYIYNYFPTNIGENETHTREISTLKMAMIHAIMGEDTKYLTHDEELKSFFAKQYADLAAEQESESWDTPYRVILDEMENTPEMKAALELPTRSKVRRLTVEQKSGVLAFAKKGDDYVFKFGENGGDIKDIAPEKAFKILKAEKDETGYDLSEGFMPLFGKVKNSLFVHETESDTEKTKRDALDKVRIIARAGACDSDFVEDLKTAIERDSLSGYSLRAINKLKPSEYAKLPEVVNPQYIQAALQSYDSVSLGTEMLIIAEEMQNINTHPQTEIIFE